MKRLALKKNQYAVLADPCIWWSVRNVVVSMPIICRHNIVKGVSIVGYQCSY